jgi:hypothetical protein
LKRQLDEIANSVAQRVGPRFLRIVAFAKSAEKALVSSRERLGLTAATLR